MIKSRRMRWIEHIARIGEEEGLIYGFGGNARKKETTRRTYMYVGG
jgi:hypothetical protein